MADNVVSHVRSRMMAGIRSRDTQPELLVRRYLHAAGFRFRLHAKNMPGTPDVVLKKYRAVIFVHGCFWHQHLGCSNAKLPATRSDFWKEKLVANRVRDSRNRMQLLEHNWRVAVVWECALRKSPQTSLHRLQYFLLHGMKSIEINLDQCPKIE